MARVFLDTNLVIDIAQRKIAAREALDGQEVSLSPFSIHILCYAHKIKIPNKELDEFVKEYRVVDLTEQIMEKSLSGPTSDLEDNIQLHSAAEADCEYFLTRDEKLLKLKFFGKTQITSSLD